MRTFRPAYAAFFATFGLATVANAAPITIGSTTFALGINAFPNSVTQIAGLPPFAFGGISATAGLTGADIDTGAFNLNSTQIFELSFNTPIINQPGDDIYFTDGRFSDDALDFSLDGGTTFFSLGVGDFTDTGVNSVIRNTAFSFDLYAATVDMTSFGFSSGDSITSIQIRGVVESDPIVVGNLNSVPAPGTIALLAMGFAGIGFRIRNRR
jgi:hypothetical protein